MENRPVKRVLVLSGGGARGAYQVGVCQHLACQGWEPDMVLGNSIGATNGAILIAPNYRAVRDKDVDTPYKLLEHVWLNHMVNEHMYDPPATSVLKIIRALQDPAREPEAYEDLVSALLDTLGPEIKQVVGEIGKAQRGKKKISQEQVARWSLDLFLALLGKILQRPALMRRRGWRRALKRYVKRARLRSPDVPYFGVAATDVATGVPHMFWNRLPPGVQGTKTRIRVDHIMGSSSIPAIYRATRIGSGWRKPRYWWWDGVLNANAPIAPALDVISSVESIVVVLMVPWFQDLQDQGLPLPHGRPTVADGLTRFLDWMQLAQLRCQLDRLDPNLREKIWIVAPAQLSDPISIIDYGQMQTRDLIYRGRQDAQEQLKGLFP
jgi:predicted acylesterase/phospholipase RssA